MTLTPTLADIAVRILLTAIACAVIGFERGESGKAAGLRTTLLVGLAACFAMLLANVLMGTRGRTPDAFVTMDVMRLPLGVLSGVGFIGGGAILRRGSMLIGVTTAATLWFVTILGLCFGAGEIWLGLGGFVLGVAIIQVLRIVEPRVPRERQATLTVRFDRAQVDAQTLMEELGKPPFRVVRASRSSSLENGVGELRLQLTRRVRDRDHAPPPIIGELEQRTGIQYVGWDAGGLAADG